MIINDKRALAYVTQVDEIKPIEGADRIEHCRVGGWWCIITKEYDLKVGDKVVYFEIDSKCPDDDERFKFLEPRKFKIKSIKMRGVYSQGLVMPVSTFEKELGADPELMIDCTELLNIRYSVEEDNTRKSNNAADMAFKTMCSRHKKFFQNKLIKKFMKYKWFRRLMFMLLGKKNDKPRDFPSFVKKTYEERIENMPWVCGNGKVYVASEKLDGTSSTYALMRKNKNRINPTYEFYVCSRNVRQKDETQKCYHDHNIYWDMAFKYHIEDVLKSYMETHPECEYVVLQGESVGSVQGNPLKLAEDDFYAFNLIDDVRGRYGSYEAREWLGNYGVKFVPLLGTVVLPDSMEELKTLADGKSVVNPKVLREGIVYRSVDGVESFKNVSREYLLKKGE